MLDQPLVLDDATSVGGISDEHGRDRRIIDGRHTHDYARAAADDAAANASAHAAAVGGGGVSTSAGRTLILAAKGGTEQKTGKPQRPQTAPASSRASPRKQAGAGQAGGAAAAEPGRADGGAKEAHGGTVGAATPVGGGAKATLPQRPGTAPCGERARLPVVRYARDNPLLGRREQEVRRARARSTGWTSVRDDGAACLKQAVRLWRG